MSERCPVDFVRLADQLGFACNPAPAPVHLRNPLELSNWTLPVIELLMIVGAVLALAFAIRRWRRDGDPTSVAVWFASVVYVLVIEPPLYFPETFGIDDHVGMVFAHNVFTVEFMNDRLPLYIVALYPTTLTLAFDVVRSVGVFARRGALVGAVCVGFVNACFYEVFDHLGPQLRWWAWNSDNPLNRPMFGSVPLTSVVIFATLAPAALGFLAYLLVDRPASAGRRIRGWGLVWRTAAIGLSVPVVMTILSLPASLFEGHDTIQAVVFSIELVVFAAIAAPVLFQEWRRSRREGTRHPSDYVRVFGATYLVVFAVLWLSALPEFAGAIDGVTSSGTRLGNAPYAAACFTVALACVVGVGSLRAPRGTAAVTVAGAATR